MSLQVGAGRHFEEVFNEHRRANTVIWWVLVADACVCFVAAVVLTPRKREDEDKSTAGQEFAADS